MVDLPEDFQLKFDGELVRALDGAPVDVVVNSLNALQRMVLIIGMRAEGRILGQRLKASARVKREYAVICYAPREGSHVQPFGIASRTGANTAAAAAAREKLLRTLKAFDSGDEGVLQSTLLNRRERWFMADAAAGLLPPEDSGIEVMVRAGPHGPFSFKAERARPLIERCRMGSPPEGEEEEVVGQLRTIDFVNTTITIKPRGSRAIRVTYPLELEPWLQANARRAMRLVGDPESNQMGDITSFTSVRELSEVKSTLSPIEDFESGGIRVGTGRPLTIPVTFDWEGKLFTVRNESLGIDVFSEAYSELRQSVLDELDVLWRNYALAADDELDEGAQAVKSALLGRFRADPS